MSSGQPTVALVAHGIHDAGGMERAFSELIRRTHDRVRYVVIAAELEPDLRPLVEWRRVRVPMRPIPLKIVVFALVAGMKLARTRADLVHTIGAIVPNRADVAVLQHCHAGAREALGALAPREGPALRRLNTSLKRLVALALERWCYRPGRIRLLAGVSPGVADEARRHYPGVPVTVTPNGVDVGRLSGSGGDRESAREELGLAPSDLVALFVGGDWHHKGLGIVLAGVAEARRRGVSHLRLAVVGRGDEEAFARRAADLELNGAVRFLGIRRDTERWYRAADVFVQASAYETFSLAAYEAAAAGLPVVATAVHGVEDLIRDGGGVLVPRTSAAFADALVQLDRDPELRARLASEGRRRAQAYDWHHSVGTVLAVYEDLLGRTL